MNPYFYSLGMLVTSRGWSDHPSLTMMDLLAEAIADEEKPPHPHIAPLIDTWAKENEDRHA